MNTEPLLSAIVPHFRLATDLPYPIVCAPMEPARKALLQRSWWARDFCGAESADPQEQRRITEHRVLIQHILRFGGEEVCMAQHEPDLDDLLTRGVFVYGTLALQQPMRQSECHANSAFLWKQSPDKLSIMTGYALAIDGMWRQHTWCIEQSSGRPVETTTPRLGYFGIVLDAEEALAFSQANRYEI